MKIITNNWQNHFHKTVLLFCVGFWLYQTIEIAYRGHTGYICGLLGGIAFVLIDLLNEWFTFEMDFLLQSCIGSAIITFLELIIGEFIKVNNLAPMWNYSNMPLNYDGVICLPFSLIWILLSAVAILLADYINFCWLGDDEQPYYMLLRKEILRFKK